MKRISLLAFAPIITSALFSASAQALPIKTGERFRVQIPGEYIVESSDDKSLMKLNGNIKRRLGKNLFLVKGDEKSLAAQIGHPNYAYYGNYMEAQPNDELFPDQYHHEMIQTEQAWEITKGSAEIIVAVTDNEFDIEHEDLKGQWWTNPGEIPDNGIDDDENGYIDDINGWDFMGQDNNLVDKGPTHGSHVSGIIAAKANNGVGGAGIAPNVKVMPIRWFGNERNWTSAIVAESYHYAVDNGAKIINTSYNIDGLVDDMVYLNAVKYATENDVLIFNSAGNTNTENPRRQEIKDIVLVCSVKSKKGWIFNFTDKKSSFSNYGTGIDICAPGDPIIAPLQRLATGGELLYGELKGTSMASPAAAAVAALIWSHNPNFTGAEVKQRLFESADDIYERNRSKYEGMLGAGRINAFKALK